MNDKITAFCPHCEKELTLPIASLNCPHCSNKIAAWTDKILSEEEAKELYKMDKGQLIELINDYGKSQYHRARQETENRGLLWKRIETCEPGEPEKLWGTIMEVIDRF